MIAKPAIILYVEQNRMLLATVRDVLSESNPSQQIEREFYRVTARSTGLTKSAEVVLQTTYARPTFR